MTKNNKSIGCNWIITIIGLAASVIGIYIFVTGKQSLNLFDKTETVTTPTSVLPTPTETFIPEVAEIITGATEYSNRLNALSTTSPASWFPDDTDIPSTMYLDTDKPVSNREASELFTNSSAMYENFENWGRTEGQRRIYYDELRCDQFIGIASIDIQTSLYSSPDGAYKFFDYYLDELNEMFSTGALSEQYTLLPLGDYGLISHSYEKNFCTQKEDGFQTVKIIFERQVAFVYIEVSAISYTVADYEIEQVAMRLAQYIDLKLIEASQ